jgi:hypothetical protein
MNKGEVFIVNLYILYFNVMTTFVYDTREKVCSAGSGRIKLKF